MYRLVIGTKNWSSWSLRAWLAMKTVDVPFDEVMIPLRRPDSATAIQAQSPSARVPVLRINEGGKAQVVFDSLAIAETLAERHPEAGLWPDEPAARAQARSYAAEMHSGFLALREALPMDFARKLEAPTIDGEVKGQIARIQRAWQVALTEFGGDGGFLFDRYSIADCMYAPVVSRFVTYGIAVHEDLQSYVERVMALPSMRQWHAGAEAEIANGLPDQWGVEMVRNAR